MKTKIEVAANIIVILFAVIVESVFLNARIINALVSSAACGQESVTRR